MIRVIICGSKGKCGSSIYNYLLGKKDIKIIGEVNLESEPLDSLIENKNADVVIDFTNAQMGYKHGLIALSNRINYISGSTGIEKEKIEYLQKIANKKNVRFIHSSNFAYGIEVFEKIIPIVEPYFTNVSVSESHHKSKKDRPSGTALRLVDKLCYNNVNINVIRNDDYDMYHNFVFYSPYERLIITHVVNDRRVFGEGVYQAILKIRKDG